MVNSQNLLDDDDYQRKKINFWIVWTAGNALGAAMGWMLGQIIGKNLSEVLGFQAASWIANLLFEFFIWIPRITIAQYFQKRDLMRYIEFMIWITVEINMLVIVGFIVAPKYSHLQFDGPFADALGCSMFMLLVMMGLSNSHLVNPPKKWTRTKSIWWIMKAALKTLLWFTLIVASFGTILFIANRISDFPQTFLQVVSWGIAGLFFGGSIGAITGFNRAQSVNRRNNMLA